MKVYAIFVGSIYEGGSITDIFTKKETAILEAGQLVDQEKARVYKAHPVNFEMYGEWKEVPVKGKTVKGWQNLIKEILIYEYDLK